MPPAARPAPFRHGTPSRTAIVVINLGTPDAPTAPALKRYLQEFLSDPRVVEIPRIAWLPILHGIILNVRPKKSAAKYASIWTPEGSPLKVHTERQAKLLKGLLGERGHEVLVLPAMRYGSPSIPQVLAQLAAENVTRVLLLPLYPQYAASTTATALDAALTHFAGQRNLPELRMVRAFADDTGYIAALAQSVRDHWTRHGRGERLLMSFHGVPRYTLDKGDPYHCECQKSARLLAEALELSERDYQISFQSRFGKAEWLQPYTAPTAAKLAREGIRRLDVICPGFVADCLETLEEIAMEVKHDFLAAGGKEFNYIPCLNERADWIVALGDLAERHLAGWPTKEPVSQDRMALQALRAKALGAAG